jgi:hypothetical protein
MKNTTGMKKRASNSSKAKISNYAFWLVLSCVVLAAVWWCIFIILGLAITTFTNTYIDQVSNGIYGVILSIAAFTSMYAASALSVPFAVVLFKRLNIEKPVLSAIAFFMAVATSFSLFASISSVVYLNSAGLYAAFIIGALVSGVVFGLVVRRLKHRVHPAIFIVITVGLTILPIVLSQIWRAVVVNFL